MRGLPAKFLQSRWVRSLTISLVVFMALILLWPVHWQPSGYSTIVNDDKGQLLSAAVAPDGQWRFPLPDSVPYRVATSIRYFEDEYFYLHPGINPVSILRASWQNLTKGKVVSGASTLTMQIARMNSQQKRTVLNKLSEMMVALKLELLHSKDSLMVLYAGMAPFGGNVVGIEAASWRYFGRAPHLLSWGEAATLAVLPNNPGAIFPGTKDSLLLNKRNRLLKKLWKKEVIDSLTYALAMEEPLPQAPLPLPNRASHVLTSYSKENMGQRLSSTLDPFWQARVGQLAEHHHQRMQQNGVDNVAALVVRLDDGAVLAYKGNTDDPTADGYQVDMLQSRRSPGSTLKPILYAAAIDRGLILKKTLLADIPSFFGGFAPKNFNYGHTGMMPADEALSRSLNIPFVHLLDAYSYEQFHRDLNDWGLKSLDKPAGHYGLTLVLGGCELTPWELAQLYFSMYRKMAGQPNLDIHFDGTVNTRKSLPLGADALWQTFKTMTTLIRPEGEKSWRTFTSSQVVSWKTGTSHGFRDAWAIGLNGEVLVLVWVGNADGEGRADLTGIKAAAPLLHNILRLSDHDREWLDRAKPFLPKRRICPVSGLLAGAYCEAVEQETTSYAERVGPCTYHRQILTDATGQYQVNSDCYTLANAKKETHFVLPPVHAFYYAKEHAAYEGLPPLHPDCLGETQRMGIIYPNENSRVFIPKEITGERGRLVFQATHLVPDMTLFWHVDEHYLGKTKENHQMDVWLPPGAHTLSITDTDGNSLTRRFEVVGDNR